MPIVKTDKETIILKSIHLFKVQGYYHTSMANIGKATGLIKGSIYHHFESKESLALACLQYIHQYFKRNIYTIADDERLSDVDKLKQFTQAVEVYFLNSEGGCLLGNFTLEVSNNIPLLKTEIMHYFDGWEQALFKILVLSFGEHDAREQAKIAVASTQGSIMMMRLYDSPDIFIKYNKEVCRLLSY